MSVQASRWRKARVQARLLVTSGLQVIPQPAVHRLRQRYLQGAAARRGSSAVAYDRLVALLRHRTLAPMEHFAVHGSDGVRLVAVDSRLVRLVYWYGQRGYEGHEVELWRLFCSQARCIVEIGANVGYFTVQGASAAPQARYLAVEAHPDSIAIVRRNVELNGLANVELVHAAAMGAPDGDTVELSLPELEVYAAPTEAFVASRAEGVPTYRPTAQSITVPVAPSAPLLADADLVKLDVEGMEADVLAPVMSQLLSSRPVLFLEVLRHSSRLRALLVRLLRADYRVIVMGSKALVDLDERSVLEADLQPCFGGRDVIALPAERADLLDRARQVYAPAA